jgi:hypothetical protein
MLFKCALLVASLALISACTNLDAEKFIEIDENETNYSKMESELAMLHMEIASLSQQGTCSSDSQCQTIDVGVKPCGGPEYFYAYSIADPRMGQFLGYVNKYNQLSKKLLNKNRGEELSDCIVVEDSGAQCLAGTCSMR